MEIMRTSMLPRRLTQMYTDTKKSFEQIIQTNITDPQLSLLNVKLRIQKDRFIAWGLDWEDSNAERTDDIDRSLDCAGLSDLVASIISTTHKLIDEADQIQPQSQVQPPGGYPIEKAGINLLSHSSWGPAKAIRLEDILRDITTSIDTLCDLSRSRHDIPHFSRSPSRTSAPSNVEKAQYNTLSSASKGDSVRGTYLARSQSDFVSSRLIDPNDLIYPQSFEEPTTTPPSYNSTATDPGSRVFAFWRNSGALEKTSSSFDQSITLPVLVDYYVEVGAVLSLHRFEDLVLSLQGLNQEPEHLYTGSLKILGFFADADKSRFAFVYKIPQPPLTRSPPSSGAFKPPQSLLAYLQHSGDTDSSNVPCLEDRFRLALNLVSNLLHIHAKGLTHRNISSNNIVFASDALDSGTESKPWKEGVIRKPYLVSWDQCAEDSTSLEPETLISNIYRPPGIERGQRSRYRPSHDIYSLGLVLLEIGLWMPLNKLWKTKYARSDFKARLQAIYAKKLDAKCGTAFMKSVEYCLQVLDEDYVSRAAARANSPERQAIVQNDYYWNVVKPLERCCVMDVSDEPRVVPALSASGVQPKTQESRPSSSAFHTKKPRSENGSVKKEQNPQHMEWKPRKGFSPKYPKGISLPVWSYKVDRDCRDYYDSVVVPRIFWMADKAIPIKEGYDLSLCMTGSSREAARPTIVMVCKSLSVAWKILNKVNEEKQIFDIYVAPGQLRHSKGMKKSGRKSKKVPRCEDKPGQYPTRYQQKPTCGASIGCFVDEQHSEAVTFGGVVLVNGEPYGMSVHHVLEDSGPDDGALSLEEPDLDETSAFEVSFDEMASDMMHQGNELEDLPDGFDAMEILKAEAEGEDSVQGNQSLSIRPGHGEPIIVTQPALDDVDPNYFPSEDEMSDDHLVIHGLGTIHASSGLRRLKYKDVAHEIDWALFKFHDDRKATLNAVNGGTKYCDKANGQYFPSKILKADTLGDLEVHAFGSTSGLETGRIRPDMEFTRMPGRRCLSPVWKFEGNFGVGGDSGAWIIDNKTGGLCGHVSSFSESQQYGVLAPMEAQLHDMEETLQAKVALPAAKNHASLSFREQILEQSPLRPTTTLKDRRSALGSDYASDDEEDLDRISTRGNSPPESPGLATSPPSSSSAMRKLSELGSMSLNDVADKWQSSQKKKKRNSIEQQRSSPKDGRSRAGTTQMSSSERGAVKATC